MSKAGVLRRLSAFSFCVTLPARQLFSGPHIIKWRRVFFFSPADSASSPGHSGHYHYRAWLFKCCQNCPKPTCLTPEILKSIKSMALRTEIYLSLHSPCGQLCDILMWEGGKANWEKNWISSKRSPDLFRV